MWVVKFLTAKRLGDIVKGGPPETVDIGPYLPVVVKKDITRKYGTVFRIQFI